ncbi:MAG: DegV family protein [Lachnospiraceae bacterium]|nr:DegV family protein [Lachnospiraceae bacterium]MCD7841501.1 DegV family protein [Lachnospiraceae bacterium]
MDYEIFVDMSLDIDVKIAERYGIRFVPMEYMLGGETFRATGPESDERMHNFYESMRQNIPTKTSQITPYQYEETFGPAVKEGKAILYIALSSGLSKTYESALLAVDNMKDEYENVQIEVIDSLSATGGMGMLAESAAKNREAGMTLEENAKWLRDNLTYLNHWFMVEDLVYLRRGGRISAATAIVGSALNIKPLLTIDAEGKLVSVANKRGSRQAMRALAEYYRTRYDARFGNAVYICCADCRDSAAELKNMVLNINPDADVRITMLCPVIGAHTGPGMLSMIFYGAATE